MFQLKSSAASPQRLFLLSIIPGYHVFFSSSKVVPQYRKKKQDPGRMSFSVAWNLLRLSYWWRCFLILMSQGGRETIRRINLNIFKKSWRPEVQPKKSWCPQEKSGCTTKKIWDFPSIGFLPPPPLIFVPLPPSLAEALGPLAYSSRIAQPPGLANRPNLTHWNKGGEDVQIFLLNIWIFGILWFFL